MERSSEVKEKGNDAIQCILRKNSQLGGLDDLNESSFSGMLQAEPIGLTDLSKAQKSQSTIHVKLIQDSAVTPLSSSVQEGFGGCKRI